MSGPAQLAPPAIGQIWPGQGGIYAGIVAGDTGEPNQHLILALVPAAERLSWDRAVAWAKSVQADGHADFSLPSRAESTLLFQNVRDQFERTWYWTGTQFSRNGAFGQFFADGGQDSLTKSYEARVRAVRRFNVESLNHSVGGVRADDTPSADPTALIAAAQRQIAGVLAALEQSSGQLVESIAIESLDLSRGCDEVRGLQRRVAITTRRQPGCQWEA